MPECCVLCEYFHSDENGERTCLKLTKKNKIKDCFGIKDNCPIMED